MNSDQPIDVKIGTKTEALWEKVRKEALVLIEQSENNLAIQREILGLAESIIKKEQSKSQATISSMP